MDREQIDLRLYISPHCSTITLEVGDIETQLSGETLQSERLPRIIASMMDRIDNKCDRLMIERFATGLLHAIQHHRED